MAYYGRRRGNQRKQKNPLKYALRLLRYRVRFENELRRRLKNQGFSEEEIEDTIATLKRQGYIDDEKSAFLFAIDEMRLKLFGPKILKMKLRSLGVDEETSERAIEKALSEIDFSEELKRLKTRFKDRREIKDYLYKRGFEISHIEEILDQIDGGEQ